MKDEELQALALALLPHLLPLLQPPCDHQYVLSSEPRRHYTTHETWITYEFFCERCVNVQHRTKVINRRGGVTWRNY